MIVFINESNIQKFSILFLILFLQIATIESCFSKSSSSSPTQKSQLVNNFSETPLTKLSPTFISGTLSSTLASTTESLTVQLTNPPLIEKYYCGVQTIKPSITEANLNSRIINGEEAVANSWPWAVSLRRISNNVLIHFCGGSLVSAEYVLTVAHCFENRSSTDITVIIGNNNILKR